MTKLPIITKSTYRQVWLAGKPVPHFKFPHFALPSLPSGYVMEHTRLKAQALRQVIAQAVSSDPVTYNEGFLGMENEEYCKWVYI